MLNFLNPKRRKRGMLTTDVSGPSGRITSTNYRGDITMQTTPNKPQYVNGVLQTYQEALDSYKPPAQDALSTEVDRTNATAVARQLEQQAAQSAYNNRGLGTGSIASNQAVYKNDLGQTVKGRATFQSGGIAHPAYQIAPGTQLGDAVAAATAGSPLSPSDEYAIRAAAKKFGMNADPLVSAKALAEQIIGRLSAGLPDAPRGGGASILSNSKQTPTNSGLWKRAGRKQGSWGWMA